MAFDKPKMFVFLHGYDATGEAMMVLDAPFRKLAPEGSQFFYPNAPFKTGGGKGYNWFSFVFGDNPFDINEEYIYHSMQLAMPYLKNYIGNHMDRQLFSTRDLVLVGFSQGAGLAVHASMRMGEPICGAISFSGGFANPHNEAKGIDIQDQKSPVCFIHGDKDPILPYQFSVRGNKILQNAGFESECHILKDTKHLITPEAIDIAGDFLKRII